MQNQTAELRQAIATAKSKIKSGQCTDVIVCCTFYEDKDDTYTVIINPNFIQALTSRKLPDNMEVITMDMCQTPQAISGLIYSLGLVDGE